jgi:hypothetical protein
MQRFWIVLVILLIVALIGLGLYGVCGFRDDSLQCLRDIAIIVLVLETFVVTILMALIVLLFGRLVSTVQNAVTPIMESAKRTVDTVQGTTTFVSDTLVAPLIGLAGFGSALKGTVSALFGRRKNRRS